MSENTALYPSRCEGPGCVQLLYGPVAYCPFCGVRHEAKVTTPKSEPTVLPPGPGPKPFRMSEPTGGLEKEKPKAAPTVTSVTPPLPEPPATPKVEPPMPPPSLQPPVAQDIQRPPVQTGFDQGGTDRATVAAANPGMAHADTDPLVSQSPQTPPTTNTSAQASLELDTTQEPGKGKQDSERIPGWAKILVTVAVLLVAWLVFRPGDDKAINAEFKEAQASFARKDLSAARQGLEHVLAKRPGHTEAARLLEEIKLHQQQLGKSLDQAERLVSQGTSAKAKAMAQTVLAEDSSNPRARELLARINQQSELRGTCTTTANLAFAAIKAQNLESAKELLGTSRASGCPEAERIEKALAKAETPDTAPAQPKPGPSGGSRVDQSMALTELDKAMRLVTEGNWKMGREKAESIRALSGNDSTIQSAVARVLRAADQERAAQAKAIVIQ